jgi:O-antigen ligase
VIQQRVQQPTIVTVPPAAVSQAPAAPQPALYVAVVYIFITYTRLPEIILIMLGRGVRLALLAAILALLVVVLSGGLFRMLSSKIVLALFAFTGWLCVCIPFSVWRGGSFEQFRFWLVSLITLVLLAGCLNGIDQCRKAMFAMAASVIFIELLSFALGVSSGVRDVGRFSLVSGTFANPNDFATLLLLGLPFCLLVVRTRSGFSVLRAACLAALFLIPITVVRTGSRGGLLAFVIMFLLYFISVPPLQKVPLAVGALVLAAAAVLFSTSNALERYKTIFVSAEAKYQINSAEASAALSTQSRKEMFRRSVAMTLEHPILGVGPGMFAVADAKEAEGTNRRAAWHQTHNTYTEISSEAGLPALFLYLAALFFCFQTVREGRKFAAQHPDMRLVGDMAFCLRLSVLSFAITAIFASNAFYFYFPLVAGLCAAFERALKSEMLARETRPSPQLRLTPLSARPR